MKQPITLSLFLLGSLGLVPTFAAPVAYQINFTAQSGILPTAGGFIYDSAAPSFSSFTFTWQGIVYDMTAEANAPVAVSGGCVPGPAGAFLFLSTGSCDGAGHPNEANAWSAYVNQSSEGAAFSYFSSMVGEFTVDIDQPLTFNHLADANAFGTFTVTAVPEPSSYALLALGCAVVARLGRRGGGRAESR